MNKKLLLLSAFIAMVLLTFIVGCSSGGGDSTEPPPQTATTTVILTAYTRRIPAANPPAVGFVRCDAASRNSIKNQDPKSIKFPDNSSYTLASTSGSVTANDYYVGNSATSLGSINDPLSETTLRQLNVDVQYVNALNGDYTFTLGSQSKTFQLPVENYMSQVSESDITLASGGPDLRVSGDTIYLNNQNTPGYRYFCRIYNGALETGGYERYWTSADVRNLDWTDPNSLSDFCLNKTVAPVNGTVSFVIPGGVLQQENNMQVIIWAFDTTAVTSDTSGSFKSFTWAISELKWLVNAN